MGSNVPMTRPEECLAVHKGLWGHSSTFLELASGRIIHYWGQASYSDDGGLTWYDPEPWTDVDVNVLRGGPASLVHLSGDGIGLAAAGAGAFTMCFWRSEDGGKTWQRPIPLQPGWYYYAIQNGMIRTSSGRIILPGWTKLGIPAYQQPWPFVGALQHDGQYMGTTTDDLMQALCGTYISYSDDDGKTWHRSGTSVRPGAAELIVVYWLRGDLHYDMFNEGAVVETEPGKLLMLGRTRLGRLFQSRSDDDGETWTRPEPTMLASSGSPAAMGKIPDSEHLVVVWSQHNEPEIRRGLVRCRLSSAVSRNGGVIWEFFQNVESVLEETRVAPGPIHPVHPSEAYSLHDNNGWWVEWPIEDVKPLPEGYGRWSYPSMLIIKDRVLIQHTYGRPGEPAAMSILKVLPLSWFYAGHDRFEGNPYLKKFTDIYDAYRAKP